MRSPTGTGGVFVGSTGGDARVRITSAPATTFTVGSANTFTVTTTGMPRPTVTSSGALPAGVTFTDNGDGTATLAGSPDPGTGGTYALTFTASNGIGDPAVQNFTLTVQQPAAITSANAVTFVAQTAGSFTVTATGSPTPVLTQTGALPSGVTFVDHGDGTATLGGTPAAGTAGTYPLTLTATNGVGAPFNQPFTLTVNAVNRAPSFTKGADQTVLEDAGPQTVSGWATDISAGAGETQVVTFEITGNTNPALFSAGPAVNGTNGQSDLHARGERERIGDDHAARARRRRHGQRRRGRLADAELRDHGDGRQRRAGLHEGRGRDGGGRYRRADRQSLGDGDQLRSGR